MLEIESTEKIFFFPPKRDRKAGRVLHGNQRPPLHHVRHRTATDEVRPRGTRQTCREAERGGERAGGPFRTSGSYGRVLKTTYLRPILPCLVKSCNFWHRLSACRNEDESLSRPRSRQLTTRFISLINSYEASPPHYKVLSITDN